MIENFDEILKKFIPPIIIGLFLFFIFFIFLLNPFKKLLKRKSDDLKKNKQEIEKNQTTTKFLKKEQQQKLLNLKTKTKDMEKKIINNIKETQINKLIKIKELKKNILEQTKLDIERYKKNSENEVKKTIVENSIFLSKEIINNEMNEEIHKKLIDEFIKSLDEK